MNFLKNHFAFEISLKRFKFTILTKNSKFLNQIIIQYISTILIKSQLKISRSTPIKKSKISQDNFACKLECIGPNARTDWCMQFKL